MRTLRTVWLFAVLLAFSQCVQAADFEFGPRPPLSVFDPADTLAPETIREISGGLASIHKKEGVDVIVVVLPDLGQAPPEHVAKRFADAWCVSGIHCVVLHSPGREESPWIVPGGKLMSVLEPRQVEEAVSAARRRASAETKDADKVKAAATEATDVLRYWLANAINRSQTRVTESTRMRLEQETKNRQKQIAVLGGLAAFVPVLVGLSLVVSLIRRKGPRHFPHHVWQLRLGAPYSGGNHAVVTLGPPPKNQS